LLLLNWAGEIPINKNKISEREFTVHSWLFIFCLFQELEQLQSELRPLEAQKEELREWAERRTQMLTWIGLGNGWSAPPLLSRLGVNCAAPNTSACHPPPPCLLKTMHIFSSVKLNNPPSPTSPLPLLCSIVFYFLFPHSCFSFFYLVRIEYCTPTPFICPPCV
jgi:hypothetical protein